jgi:PleD family two-component response regulator
MTILKHFTLLIVEDNQMAQDQLKQIFDGYFKAIHQAYDGDEALRVYRENNPDIASSATQLIHASDHAMYRAKKNGKRHYAFSVNPKSSCVS